MESHDYGWPADIKQIKSPAMLIFADADSTCPEHIAT
jgi:hypothetical protein